jgi:hypothetical protein
MLGCSLFFLGFMAFTLALPLIDPIHASLAIVLVCVPVFGLFATLGLRSFGRLRDSVAVNSEGIWYLPLKGESTFIAWRDVANVRADDTGQRLVLVDGTGGRSIRLEYQLEDFGRLREFVLRHTAESARRCAPGVNIFHRTRINKVILLGFAVPCLFLARLSFHQGQPRASLFFIGLAGLIVASLTQDPTRAVITRDAVVIKYPGWKRTIPFDVISGIVLADVCDRGNVWAAVIIERWQGRPLKLFRFREGSLALHDALYSAWRSAGGGEKAGR